MQGAYRRGIEAFNHGRFFEAHEHWEEVWRAAAPTERAHYRALIQLAAACVKLEHGDLAPAHRLLVSALEGLGDAPDGLREGIGTLLARLESGSPFEPEAVPRLELPAT